MPPELESEVTVSVCPSLLGVPVSAFDADEEPLALFATTEQLYSVPFVSPVIVSGELGPVTEFELDCMVNKFGR